MTAQLQRPISGSPRRRTAFGRAVLLLPLLALAPPVSAAEYPFTAVFHWRSEGEIYQVWLHREFNGRLLQTAPIELQAGPELQELLDGVAIECTAKTAIGLPNWSTTSGACVLSRPQGSVTFEVDCRGTQTRCEGTWRITGGTGAFRSFSGSGSVVGHLIEPSPLPWFWDGPTAGYNQLRGTIVIP